MDNTKAKAAAALQGDAHYDLFNLFYTVRYNRRIQIYSDYYHGSTLIGKTTFWNLLRVS